SLSELTLAQPGQFVGSEPRWWPYPGGRWTRLGRGPALRLVSGNQQWLLPLRAPRELAAIVLARAAVRQQAQRSAVVASTPSIAQWRTLQSWAARQLTTMSRGGSLMRRTVGFRLVAAFPALILGSVLLGESISRGAASDGGVVAVAGAALLVATVLVSDWVRVRGRTRVAEDNALPPNSPDWGELRPDYAPMSGWQPWHESPGSAVPP
ncbi:MAG: hypothetical protein ACRDTD_26460, partial [Pseudonocardiaceae bacterium]